MLGVWGGMLWIGWVVGIDCMGFVYRKINIRFFGRSRECDKWQK